MDATANDDDLASALIPGAMKIASRFERMYPAVDRAGDFRSEALVGLAMGMRIKGASRAIVMSCVQRRLIDLLRKWRGKCEREHAARTNDIFVASHERTADARLDARIVIDFMTPTHRVALAAYLECGDQATAAAICGCGQTTVSRAVRLASAEYERRTQQ
jgi:DNA-directed RNA polymerase specialized sigma24 family protein